MSVNLSHVLTQALDSTTTDIRKQIAEEDKVNSEIENYLKETHKKLTTKVGSEASMHTTAITPSKGR